MLRNAKLFLSIGCLVFQLLGCSQSLTDLHNADDLQSLASALQQMTVADLDAATLRATAAGDTIGAMCYPVLKKYVQQGVAGTDKVAGVIDAFEKARLASKKIVSAEVPEDLRIACSPLLMDTRDLGLRIAAMVRR